MVRAIKYSIYGYPDIYFSLFIQLCVRVEQGLREHIVWEYAVVRTILNIIVYTFSYCAKLFVTKHLYNWNVLLKYTLFYVYYTQRQIHKTYSQTIAPFSAQSNALFIYHTYMFFFFKDPISAISECSRYTEQRTASDRSFKIKDIPRSKWTKTLKLYTFICRDLTI